MDSSDKLKSNNILEMTTISNSEIIYINDYYAITKTGDQYYFQVRC